MTFIHFCVGIVILIVILAATILFGAFLGWISDDGMEFGMYLAWLFSSVGFAVCLSMLLFQNGVI